MLDRLGSTIDKIYAAATDGARWGEALASIEDLTGSAGAVVGFIPKQEADCGFNLAGRFTEEQCAIYSSTYQPICRRTRYMIDHPELDVIHDSLLITEREMDRDPVYDWFGQHDLRYFVGTSLPATGRYQVVCSLQRSRGQGHVEAGDVDLFKLLKPHLARAVFLADQLGTLRTRQRFSLAVIEALPQAVLALDGQGRLLFANPAGHQLLVAADGIAIRGGRVVTAAPRDQRLLDNAMSRAIGDLALPAGGWAKISRPSGCLPYVAFVAPLHGAEQDQQMTEAAARLLVIVHDPGVAPLADTAMLTSVYELTEMQARLASALSGGHSVESAAALLRIQPSTARAHLKAVFRKVGVNRQQDLVRVLASLATMALIKH